MDPSRGNPVPEAVYVSWGGTGRSEAVRSAFDRVGKVGLGMRYLAILDDEQFGDLTPSMTRMVREELEWLLAAELRLVDLQTKYDVAATIDVREGDVEDVVVEVTNESSAKLILLGAPLPSNPRALRRNSIEELIVALQESTGAEVEIVGPRR